MQSFGSFKEAAQFHLQPPQCCFTQHRDAKIPCSTNNIYSVYIKRKRGSSGQRASLGSYHHQNIVASCDITNGVLIRHLYPNSSSLTPINSSPHLFSTGSF